MSKVDEIGREGKIWVTYIQWDVETLKKMW